MRIAFSPVDWLVWSIFAIGCEMGNSAADFVFEQSPPFVSWTSSYQQAREPICSKCFLFFYGISRVIFEIGTLWSWLYFNVHQFNSRREWPIFMHCHILMWSNVTGILGFFSLVIACVNTQNTCWKTTFIKWCAWCGQQCDSSIVLVVRWAVKMVHLWGLAQLANFSKCWCFCFINCHFDWSDSITNSWQSVWLAN